jgi:hypothetical protein
MTERLAPPHWPGLVSTKSQVVTLIAKSGRDLIWAASVTDKRDLVAASKGPLWAVWTGQYSSRLFTVSRKQVVEELST